MFTVKYFIAVATVAIGASTQFYSYGIVNPVLPLVTEWINQTYIERYGTIMNKSQLNIFWSFVVSSMAIGGIFGSLMTRIMADRFGRKNGLLINGIANIIGAFLELIAKVTRSPELLIVGRIILGFNTGLASGLAPIYLMEITPSKYRGAAGTIHQLAVAFSDWFSLLIGLPELLGNDRLWPVAFAFPGIQALALCLILPFCPESPRYILWHMKDKDETMSVIKKFVDEQHANDILHEIIEETSQIKGSYRELFTRKELLRPMMISLLVMITQQFTGCSIVFAYSTNIFVEAGLSLPIARYSTLIIGIAYFLTTCLAPYLIEKVGRRKLLLFQLSSCEIAIILLMGFAFLQNYCEFAWASNGSAIALLLYMLVYGVGSPIPWMITSEMFDTEVKKKAPLRLPRNSRKKNFSEFHG
ncbi:unnamed protein product [Dracunculus medinensis]|uniref:MFS domain-containing protein n=1 Tax=Dracunculus medinensis TaxID=318479 RepID=A0A0N4UQX9_DRAME|nr:unnamed protein product [Dracunculus medinensis]